jgi:DNA end-binding protein Ku
MAPRPTWQGHLRLSLVTCPVALYTGTTAAGDVSFHLINPETNNRIKMITTDPDTGPVDRSALVKGYEFEKGRYVIVSPEELEAVRIESSRVIDIERFVDESEIDRLYWDSPYYLVPDGKMAQEAFTVIREAMSRAGKIALGRLVMHQRERLMALEARPPGIVAYRLRAYDEVRKPEDYFRDIPDSVPNEAMVEIAGKIIEQIAGPFEPETFRDRYEDALRALIDAKIKGEAVDVKAPKLKEPEVDDLMALLKQSLQAAAPPARRAPAKDGRKTAAAPRKPAAEPKRRSTAGRRS